MAPATKMPSGARQAKELRQILSRGPYRAELAQALGLIDHVGFESELKDWVGAKDKKGELLDRPAADYLKRRRARYFLPLRRRPVTAVVQVAGTIIDQAVSPAQRGGALDTIARALEAAERSRRVKSVVLHVDSRGGSAFASAMIHHAVRRLAAKKPVVAYFGDYAASGGYYVAMGTRAIVARPLTVTGSIGVVAVRPVVDGALARWKIHRDGAALGDHAGLLDATQKWSASERAAIAREIDAAYQEFTGVVMGGRGLTAEQVDTVARGRVFLARRAQTLGLVDEMGGLMDAVRKARALAPARYADEPVVVSGGRPRLRFGGDWPLPFTAWLARLVIDVVVELFDAGAWSSGPGALSAFRPGSANPLFIEFLEIEA